MAKPRKSLKQERPGAKKVAPGLKMKPKYKLPQSKAQTLKSGNHSMNPDRPREGAHQRSRATINRLRMYKNFKPFRNKHGNIVQAAPFQDWKASGSVARVEPHRKWFGNTRVIGQEQLQKFQENLGKVVLRQTKLPITLLQEKAKQQRVHVVDTESFEHTFGKKALRKKAKLAVDTVEALAQNVEERQAGYKHEADRDLYDRNADIERFENKNPLFKAGQSNRVWGELYKVLDSSDVVIQVVDARDPMGTRCKHVEEFLRKEKPHKHLCTVLNKVDLVPTWCTRKWIAEFSKDMPTIAFHASIHHSFGKSAVINLLRQFAKLHPDKPQISVGFIGYPNVGKSSIVNTLRKKKVCKTAPIAGETKVWQYVMLMRRIYLIDCPGVVYPQGDTETEIILKGVVRVENVKDVENHVQGVLDRVKPEHLKRHYLIGDWEDAEDFMTKIAFKTGRLLKGGEPDIVAVAKMVLNDFQRGRLPYFVPPPGCEQQALENGEEAPINELCEDEPLNETASEKGDTTEGEETDGGNESNDDEETEGTEATNPEDEEMTDVGSCVSGLSDLSGVSDLEEDLEAMHEDDTAKDPEEDAPGPSKGRGAKKVPKELRPRGRRAGKKLTEKRKRLQGAKTLSDVGALKDGVALSKVKSKAPNMWRKKLEKRHKPKHQV
ncbi:unnamed protein product, partial [Mesorhabditis spiculigera]